MELHDDAPRQDSGRRFATGSPSIWSESSRPTGRRRGHRRQHWELRLEWEKLLAEARLLNITWPREYGGRGGSLTEEIIFHQEHAAAAAPYWVGVHGRDLFGPTLLHFGSDEQKSRFLPAITGVREFWGQGFSEPGAGSDLAACVREPCGTATTGSSTARRSG